MAKFYGVKVGRVPGVYSNWSECEAQVKGFQGAEYKSFADELSAKNYVDGVDKTIPSTSVDKSNETSVVSNTSVMSETELKGMEVKAEKCFAYLRDNHLISESLAADVKRQIDMNLMVRKAAHSTMEARNGKPFPDHIDVFVDGSYNTNSNEYGYGIYMNDGEKQRILYGRGVCQEGGRNVEGEVIASKTALSTIRLNPHYKSATIYYDYKGIGLWADGKWEATKSYTQAYVNFVNKLRENGLKVDFKYARAHSGIEGNEYVDKLAKIGCGIPLTASEEKFISKLKDVPGYPNTRELPELDDTPDYSLMGYYMN